MQIHELNAYSGELNSGAFFVVDNGDDTGRLPATAITDPLNERIDNIIAGPAPSAQEVADIRYGYNGVTYPSAGDAVRAQGTYFDTQFINMQAEENADHYYSAGLISLNASIGTVIDITNVSASTQYLYCVIPCKAGDRFIITGYAGTTPRLWAFLNENQELLSVAAAESNVSALHLTATEDGYFVSDVYKTITHSLTRYYSSVSASWDYVSAREYQKIENIIEVKSHYYTTGDGHLHYGSGFSCTNMIKVSPGDKLKITTSCGNSVGVAGYDANKVYNSRIMEVGGGAIYDVARGVLTTEIIVPADVEYITVSNVEPAQTPIIVESKNPKCIEDNPVIEMLVVPRSASFFWVYVLSNVPGRYLRHVFEKQYYTDNLSYSGGTKTVVGADIWYSTMIDEGSTNIMAGNFNFIHNISNMTGHNGYVGAGHGCTVADWTIFKADGITFDPDDTTKMTVCHEFDFIIKAKNYLIDKPNSPSESHAVPTLDENGDPIVTSINTINAHIRVGNYIDYRNRLIFVMDGIQFSECHGSMCEGYFAAFDNLIVSNIEESWNYIDASNDYAREKMGGTTWDLFLAGSKKALSVVMFGDKYRVENKLIQLDGSRNKITNTRTALYRDNGARMKVYLMPAVCTISAQNIAEGETVETFNAGDILDVVSSRHITVSEEA